MSEYQNLTRRRLLNVMAATTVGGVVNVAAQDRGEQDEFSQTRTDRRGRSATDEYVEVEPNVRLHLLDWGQGKPIVFIHGWPLSHEMFEYQYTQLAAQGYRCVGITMRGFGKSSKPYGDHNYDVFADDVKKVLDALDLRQVTLAGFSMGAGVALRDLTRHRSARVSKLALLAAAVPSFVKRPGFPYGLERATLNGFIQASLEDRAKLNSDFGKMFFLNENAVSPSLAAWFQDMGMEASSHATTSILVALRDSDLRSDLGKVRVPSAIFHSTEDKIALFELAEAQKEGIRGAELIKFNQSGHGFVYEERDKFNSELIEFVR
jgi:pimeloyl-ACP methyl ester carboxylesterase